MSVEDGGDEVEEVNRESEIGDQLGAGYEKQKKDYAGVAVSDTSEWVSARGYLPNEAVQYPNQSQYPPNCRISSQGVPAKN